MNNDFDELAGRIEGVARALLHTVAALEIRGVIDGPRLAEGWRHALPEQAAHGLATARSTLLELAQSLDDARSCRQARASK